MRDTATYRRTCAAAGLVLAAVLALAWTALQPPFPQGYADRLAAIDDAGTGGALSAALFVLSQLPMLAAVLGIAHLLRDRTPVLSNLGATLSVLGVFGHSVYGGVSLVTVVMAGDAAHRDSYAALLERVEASPVMVFAAVGMLGTVLGTIVLGTGLWRSRVVPRWVPGLLWAFVVVEFVGGSLSDYASYASGTCFLIAFLALAAQVWRSPREDWEVGARTGAADRTVPA